MVMNNRQKSSRPPKVFGLPDLEICQGSEPRLLNLTIKPETAREMEQKKLEEEIKWEREQAIRAAESPKFKRSRKRSRSKHKNTRLSPVTEVKQRFDRSENEDCSFIQKILGKYIFDYDEFKLRQKKHKLSQSIDVDGRNKSVQLPPIQSPLGFQPRVSLKEQLLKDQLPKVLAKTKIDQPFAPNPKVTQSIDFSLFKNYEKAAIQIRKNDLEAAREENND